MDFHAHLVSTEIIGLLGGKYNHDEGFLQVSMAFPCQSFSTGFQVITMSKKARTIWG